MNQIVNGLIIIAAGLGFVWLYSFVARRFFGSNMNFVQAILYKADTSSASPGMFALELALRLLKFVGLFAAVVGGISIFTG